MLAANKAACKLIGLSAEEIQGRNLRDLLQAEDQEKFTKDLRNWSASRQPVPASFKLRGEAGECVECHCHGSLLQPRTADSPALIMLRSTQKAEMTNQFITLSEKIALLEKEAAKRKRYEKAFAESNEQVRLLLDSAGEAIYGIDMEGKCTFVNAACLHLLGYEENEELLGKNMHSIIHHSYADGRPYPIDDCPIYQAHIAGQHTRQDNEVFYRKDGTAFPVDYFSHPVKKDKQIIGSVITFQDISDRKAIEAELERSQETLERAQAIAHVGSWDWDIVGGGLYWTDEIYRIFGLEPQQFGATYEAFLESIHPDDRDAVTEAVSQSVADENIPYDIVHRVVRPDGSERIVNERGKVYRSPKGAAVRMIGTVQDITEKKEAEAYKSMLFDTSPIGLALCDMQGNLIDINPAYANIIGRDIDETKKLTYWEITPEDYAEEEQQQLDSLNSSGQYGPYEKEYLHKDGHRVPVRLSGQIVEFKGERYIWSSVEDITETKQAQDALQKLNVELEDRVELRTAELQSANTSLQISLEQLKQTQDQLVQSEKMASLGGLVAGVAHEINTPVGMGVTAISHLEMKLDNYATRYETGQLTRSDFESLLKSATETSRIVHQNLNRAANLIRSFKQVAVDQTSNELREFNLSEYLDEILQSLTPKLKKGGHQVSIDCPEDIVIFNHPGALSQVMTNLIMNSLIHGFSERDNGKINIKVSTHKSRGINLEYRDDGKGLAKANVAKIFDPFFTTARNKGGSGLGMHIVFNLVTQTLGGSIECDSKEGEGIHFSIKLPGQEFQQASTAGGLA